MQIAYILIILILDIYFIGYKIRFNLDKASIIILVAQLIVMIMRIFLGIFQKLDIIEPIILVLGSSTVQATLYFFIFEMKLVAVKI